MKPYSLIELFLILCALTFPDFCSGDIVPVYMWETKESPESVPALGRINKETFKEVLKSRIQNNPRIVVFSETNLSPEDFIGHDEEGHSNFQHLADLESTARISYLPYVEDPINVIRELSDNDVTEISLETLNNQPIVPKSRILIVDLNDAKDDEDRNDMLRRHDATIFSVYKKLLKEDDNILSLFTAYHSSWIIPEDVTSFRQKRHILADPPAPAAIDDVLYETKEAMFYLKSNATFFANGTIYSIPGDATYSASSDFNNETNLIELTIKATSNDPELKMTFWNSTKGYWVWTKMFVTHMDETYEFMTSNVTAPMAFSYHCSNHTHTVKNIKPEYVYVILPGLQFQPFFDPATNASNKTFGDAYDCVGFTSAPIWSGLFVTFILAFIMTMGLTMMMDIKTMDRFDDPKGKTIIINAAE